MCLLIAKGKLLIAKFSAPNLNHRDNSLNFVVSDLAHLSKKLHNFEISRKVRF